MSSPRRVTIRYFAVLRERRGLDREQIETTQSNLGELYRELLHRHALALDPSLVRFAVGGEFVTAYSPVPDGGEVALIPPVAGG